MGLFPALVNVARSLSNEKIEPISSSLGSDLRGSKGEQSFKIHSWALVSKHSGSKSEILNSEYQLNELFKPLKCNYLSRHASKMINLFYDNTKQVASSNPLALAKNITNDFNEPK